MNKLVPETPTPEMINAAAKAHTPQFDRMDTTIQEYALVNMSAGITAAIAAAPAVQAEPVAWMRYDGLLFREPKLDHSNINFPKGPYGDFELVPLYIHASPSSLTAERDALAKRIRKLETALGDLMTWFPKEPSKPEWRLKAGAQGADDAVAFARAALEGKSHD